MGDLQQALWVAVDAHGLWFDGIEPTLKEIKKTITGLGINSNGNLNPNLSRTNDEARGDPGEGCNFEHQRMPNR
jgi:hypothetical protein